MKSYLKFLSRNKLYTAIEAVGLIVSLAFVIVIGTSLRDQLTIARDVPGGEDLYILGPKSMPYLEYRDMEAMTSLPEIEEAAAFMLPRLSVRAGDEFSRMPVLVADTRLLDLLHLRVAEGSIQSLYGGQGIALSKSAAARFFPSTEALGQHISIGSESYGEYGSEKETAEIVAVLEDADYSILDSFDVFCPMEANLTVPNAIRASNMRETSIGETVHVLASLADGVDLEAFSEKLISLVGTTLDRQDGEDMMATEYREVYFSPVDITGIRQGNRLYLNVLVILGLVLLLSAILNYMNLCSAVSGGRAKEMATRRLLGEGREHIFGRVLLESILFTAVCYILAVLLAWEIAPYLNTIRPEGIPVAFRVYPGPAFWLFSVAIVLLAGGLAGFLPARMLSSFQPIEVLSGNIRKRLKMGFNKACIIAQTVLAVVLVCMAIAFQSQLRHLETLDAGISPVENLFYFHPSSYASREVHLIGDRLSSLPETRHICFTDGIPTHLNSITTGPSEETVIHLILCDTLAFRLLGFRVNEGFTNVKPETFWPTEELANEGGVNRDNPDIGRIIPSAAGEPTEIGGIIESFRRYAVNMDDPFARYFSRAFPGVLITSLQEHLNGILIETGADHAAFKREFSRIVTEFYKETTGYFDLGNSWDSQCGYLEEIFAADYADLHRYTQIITLFALVAVFLAMLGLVAMSTWFAARNSKDIAIRKVFGSEMKGETLCTIRSYMVLVLAAVAVGVPVSIFLVGRFLERYAERITGYWWIFVSSAVFAAVISLLSVLWQTLKAAHTNPAVELKKE